MRTTSNGVSSIVFVAVLILSSQLASGQESGGEIDEDEANDLTTNPTAKGLIASMLSTTFANLSVVFGDEIKKHLGFCMLNVEKDWNDAFNFSSDTKFIEDCIDKTSGDLVQRLCTAADIKFYVKSLLNISSNYAKPNKNCNMSSWPDGCAPGWACKVSDDKKIDLRERKEMPLRTDVCAPCCAGFFCPHGLTCMMPCPLGAYCPSSKFDSETGVCDPYTYQPSPGITNHSCGTADMWADISNSNEMFCSAGSYCPNTIQEIPCKKGFYCRIGSTSPQGCFSLAKCDAESENQNIQAYGAMMFVALSVIVVIIYNCSDQVISTQERRQAKSREKAVQSIRETHEKWKSAKDIAKKHATGLQTQLSRTFSRKKTHKQPEQSRGPGQGKLGSELPLMGISEQLSASASKGKKNEKGSLTKIMHDIEDDPDSEDGFSLEMGEKNVKKGAPKGKNMHSRSQMFRYAYDQIEREKAMQEENKDLTFSGVISMAGDIEIRKRPMIEVAFKDLTLTLKGKNKHLMRCVTGKISPGRVSAVMGPSGAGKTTFLSALTGKAAAGCNVTGLILVNGKSEPIRSYKRIIGFVPQDDIVHGNLTVEENLWFSARCRLPAGLPKQEKVLVVERVIECLGLQPVRDSIVGTVEQRGISGGQKKRVNVGLEMVMEPSLLILDEPTSGLDSSSSQLLLRALRREALEGVNICMVVHQPSYALFRMFDDLVLLAKGGLTVYHGPVRKVEGYFSEIGITVPDRVNPPDHYIDILEGMVKLNPNYGVTVKQLPVRWMLHNGYPVPMDMLKYAEGMPSSSANSSSLGVSSVDSGSEGQSFAGDLWEDVKCNVEKKKDSIRHNFLSSKDLSNRNTPGASVQYRHYLGRVAKQRLRESKTQAVDYLILCLAGVCLGTVAKMSDQTFGTLGYTYTVIAVSLLCKIAALRSFSLDKLQYWRESSSGMSSLAYFLAKDTVDHFNTIIKPWVYLSMFYYCNNPRSSVVDNYTVLVCLVYCVTGIAYVFAICFEPGPAQLWCVLLPVVMTLVATQNNDGGFVKEISNYAYPRWALEAFVIANAQKYNGVWLITRCGALYKNGYDLNNWHRSLILLIINGLIARSVAYFCMVTFQKR